MIPTACGAEKKISYPLYHTMFDTTEDITLEAVLMVLLIIQSLYLIVHLKNQTKVDLGEVIDVAETVMPVVGVVTRSKKNSHAKDM